MTRARPDQLFTSLVSHVHIPATSPRDRHVSRDNSSLAIGTSAVAYCIRLPQKLLETPPTPFVHRREHRAEADWPHARAACPSAAPHLHVGAKRRRGDRRPQLRARPDRQPHLGAEQRAAHADVQQPDARPKLEPAFDALVELRPGGSADVRW